MRIGSKLLAASAALAVVMGEATPSSSVAAAIDQVQLTTEQLAEIEKSKESMTFQTEVARMLDIIINSLYTQREVFLRELVSNAADALEKARYLSISDPDYLGDRTELSIYVDYDENAKTITITDTGVGMSRSDLINNLGTLAKSGTTNFLEAMAGGSDLSLIGQFGVGFYSTFLVADKVTVVSKKKGEDQYIWESSADAQFTVVKDPRGDTLGRGTQIVLHLKEDATPLAKADQLEALVKRYSQFVHYPIKLKKVTKVSEEVVDEDAGVDETTGEAKMKTVEVDQTNFTQINTQKPIWLRSKEDVSEEEYAAFYKALTGDKENPLAHSHFNAEGDVEFKALLFVPGKSDKALQENYFQKTAALKLFVRRVLVADGVEDLLPKYLHFVRGVVDSDDLPLNVSREQLQQNKVLKTIGKNLVKRTLDMLHKLSKDDISASERIASGSSTEGDVEATQFGKVYGEFSKSLKMGCYEDDANRQRVIKLLRFRSLQHHAAPEGHKGAYHGITLEQYLDSLPEERKEQPIYYIAGESVETLRKAPHVQAFLKKGVDVLLLTEPLDEPCLHKAAEFQGHQLQNVQRADVALEDTEEEAARFKKLVKAFKPLTAWWKKRLGAKMGKVELSRRLVRDPVTVAAAQTGYSSQMERVMKTQAFADRAQLAMFRGARTLELNADHPLIQKLLADVAALVPEGGKAEDVELSEAAAKTADFLFETALIGAGFDLDAPADYASNLYDFLTYSYGVASSEPVPFDVSNVDEDEDAKPAAKEDEDLLEDFGFDDEEDGAEEIRDEL